MAQRPTFARLLRVYRLRKGLSARALSLAANLGPAYVHNVELGRWMPRPHAVRKLVRALKLSDAEAMEFYQAADIEPDRASIPDLTIWEHLPALLYCADHDPLAVWEAAFDSLLGHLVPPMASLLAWLTLTKKAPTKQQRERLKNTARMAFDKSLAANRESPQWTPIDDIGPAGVIAASILPRAWRIELFAERRSAGRLVKLVKRWSYVPPSPRFSDDRPRFGVQLADTNLAPIYEFNEIPPTLIANTHDAMTAHRLRHELDLRRELGVEARSEQEGYLASEIHTEPLIERLERRGLANISQVLSAAVERAQQRPQPSSTDDPVWALAELRARAKLALRVFQLPDLAAAALACTEAELRAALAACAEVLHDPDPRHEH